MSVTRPALRYHGGKWLLAPWIISNLPAHRIYVEPYGGAMSVLLRKRRSYAEVYGDLNGEIVNLFRVLRDNGDELVKAISLTPYARAEFDLSYDPSECEVEQARRTVVRSYMGFGSMTFHGKTGFRAFARLQSASPAHDWVNLPKGLAQIVERLQGVVIENRDALELMTAQDSEVTLHYVDPPYVPSTRDEGKDYAFEMTPDDHRQMAERLKSLEGMVVLSGYDCDLYKELFPDWLKIRRPALADGARPRIECLWLNPLAVERQRQMRLAL